MQIIDQLKWAYKVKPDVDPEIVKLGTYAMQLGLTEETMHQHVRASMLFEWRMRRIQASIDDMKREFGWDD